jgi:hypothetical protein
MPTINCCITNKNVPTEKRSVAGIGVGGITGIIIRVRKSVSNALVIGGTVLALRPTIEANNPDIRIKGNNKSAKYCMTVVVAMSNTLTLFLKDASHYSSPLPHYFRNSLNHSKSEIHQLLY